MPDPHFDGFTVPSLDDFVYGDRDELLLYPIRALQKYLSWTEQYLPGIEGLFASTGVRKKRVSRITISFWLRYVISFVFSLVSKGACHELLVRAYEIRKVVTFLSFRRNCVVHQALKVGTWSAQSTFSSFYQRCHPQAHGDIFHWACGGGSVGCVTR